MNYICIEVEDSLKKQEALNLLNQNNIKYTEKAPLDFFVSEEIKFRAKHLLSDSKKIMKLKKRAFLNEKEEEALISKVIDSYNEKYGQIDDFLNTSVIEELVFFQYSEDAELKFRNENKHKNQSKIEQFTSSIEKINKRINEKYDTIPLHHNDIVELLIPCIDEINKANLYDFEVSMLSDAINNVLDITRVCDKCNQLMIDGFVMYGGDLYYCSEECLYSEVTPEEWLKLTIYLKAEDINAELTEEEKEWYDKYGETDCYWTEWY